MRNRVDGFALERMKERELSPSGEADRRTLIRRLTFDLTGLPPRSEEVAAFLSDDAPDAYERLVDRLLGSPHYGERWGRVWLDLARYTDVRERWVFTRASPWVYRDWVVRALIANKTGALTPDPLKIPLCQFGRCMLSKPSPAGKPDRACAEKAARLSRQFRKARWSD